MRIEHLITSQNTGGNKMSNMRKEIFNVRKMAQTLRYTEYKSITSAISEIVDNSIEAGARKI